MGGSHRASLPAEPAAVEEVATGSRWVVLFLLCASLLIVAMDITALNVALPSLGDDVKADWVRQLWIVDGYALAAAALLPTAAALGERTGRRRVLMFGFAIFGLASLGAAVSAQPWQLIVSRFALGIGAAAIVPATLSMLRQVFSDSRERTLAFGVWSAVFGAGMLIGPLFGGWLTWAYDWHAVFVINVPIAMVAMLFGRWLLPDYRRAVNYAWDWLGMILSIIVVVGVAVAMRIAGGAGVADPAGLILLAVAVIAAYAFVRNSLRLRHPLLHVRLFADRGFAAGAGTVLLAMFGLVGLLLVTGRWLQYSQGNGPLGAAVRLLPLPFALVVAALAAPLLMILLSARRLLAGSLALLAVGTAVPWFASLTGSITYGPVVVYLLVAGVGGGVAITAGGVLLVAGAPPKRAADAAATGQLAYLAGGALGVAVLGGLVSTAYQAKLPAAHGPVAFGAAFGTTALTAAVILLIAAAVAYLITPRNLYT